MPVFIPDSQTQIMFIDSIKNNFTLSFDSLSTDGKTFDTQLQDEVDIGSAKNINSPKFLIVAHQSAARTAVPNQSINFANFDNLEVQEFWSTSMV